MSNTEEMVQFDSSVKLVDCEMITHPAPLKEWQILAVLTSVQFIHIMDFTMMMPLAPQFMRLFEITPQQFGLLISVYTFSAGLCGFFAAFIVDHFDRKVTIIAVCAGFGIAVLLCALSKDYATLLAARAVAGAFGGMMSAVVFSIIADIIPLHRRGAAMGAILSSFPLASVVGVPTGLFLIEWSDWRAPYFLLAILGLLIIIAIWRLLPPIRHHLTHQPEKNPLRQLHVIFSNSNHLVAFALIAMLMFAGFTVIPFISAYVVSNAGMKEADLPYLYFVGGLATFFTARLFGRLADRYDKRKIFGIVAIISIGPILLITQLSETPLLMILVVTSLFMILVSGRFIPAMALITSSVAPHLRGSFMSFNSSVQQIAAGLASLLAGTMIGVSANGKMTNFDMVGVIAAVSTVICILLAIKLKSVE